MQVDLLDFFRHERPWSQLYRLIGRLPAWGHYKSDLAMDEEWAEYILDVQEKQGQDMPGISEAGPALTPLGYSEVVARLDLIADRVMGVRTAVQAGYTQNHEEPHFEPIRRPEPAVERVRELRVARELDELDRQFRGGLFLDVE